MARIKPVTLTTECDGCTLTFGMLNRRVWVLIVNPDGTTISSLDSKKACKLASGLLPYDLWPAFARHLFVENGSLQDTLFGKEQKNV